MKFVDAYLSWKGKQILPNDDRQLTILQAWGAFIRETPYGKIGREIPEAFETLWNATLE